MRKADRCKSGGRPSVARGYLAVAGAVLVMGLAGAELLAHDFWIQPSTFRPEVGSPVAIHIRVGEHFDGDPVPRDPAHIDRFVAVTASGETPVIGLPGKNPAGLTRISAPGLVVVAYSSHPTSVDLEAVKFEQYLREEGLERIVEARAKSGATSKPVKEIYSRFAKTLIQAGPPAAGRDRVVGMRLELTAVTNPYAMTAGQSLPLTLTYEGKPLAGALVVAINRAEPKPPVRARTDSAGRVSLLLPRGGAWLVKAVHMVPAPQASGADWESFWASVTFELPQTASPVR